MNPQKRTLATLIAVAVLTSASLGWAQSNAAAGKVPGTVTGAPPTVNTLATDNDGIRMRVRPGETIPDAAQLASCVLQMTLDSPNEMRYGGMDNQTIVALLNSSGVADAAAKQVLGLTPEQRRRAVVINPAMGNFGGGGATQFVRLEVAIRNGVSDLKPDAAELVMYALCDALRTQIAESNKTRINAMQARRDNLTKELQEAQAKLDKTRATLKKYREETMAAGAAGNMSSVYAEMRYGGGGMRSYAMTATQRTQLETEVAARQARLKSLQSSWEETVKAATTRPATSDVTELVAQAEQQLREAEARKELAPAELAEARARALNARTVALLQVSGNQMSRGQLQARLADEIATLKADIAEMNARLEKLPVKDKDNKAAATQPTDHSEEIQMLSQEESSQRQEVMRLTQQLEQFKQSSRESTVTITVLGGKP